MGANLLVLASTLLLQPLQQDTSNNTEQPSNGIAYERLSDPLQYNRVGCPISPGGARRLRFDLVIEGVR
jgi:hypothetical protein